MGHSASAMTHFVVCGDFAFNFLQNYTENDLTINTVIVRVTLNKYKLEEWANL